MLGATELLPSNIQLPTMMSRKQKRKAGRINSTVEVGCATSSSPRHQHIPDHDIASTSTMTGKQSSASVPSTPNTEDTTAPMRVYVLSVLLYAMQHRKLRPTTKGLCPSDSAQNSDSYIVRQTLNEIATLLSRGIPDETSRTIAVVAGPLTVHGIAIHVVRSK